MTHRQSIRQHAGEDFDAEVFFVPGLYAWRWRSVLTLVGGKQSLERPAAPLRSGSRDAAARCTSAA